MKYSESLLDRLKNTHDYTHCFFVAGGNIMHLLDSARTRFVCVPFTHEVSAGIAAEYFNQANENGQRAFVLVTAGPGLTNCVTAIAGAFLENRELLVIGGQVKSSDLKSDNMRQNGIQEIDGVELVKSITRRSLQLSSSFPMEKVDEILWSTHRPGPVFFEIPLDQQAHSISDLPANNNHNPGKFTDIEAETEFILKLVEALSIAERPILLLGGGLDSTESRKFVPILENLGIPIMTTWNGINHYGSNNKNYWGRPNTWGQRSSNILIQQCDLLIAVGSRLSLQQTGFAWQEFCPLAEIYQIEIDKTEIEKGHPRISEYLISDADSFLSNFLRAYSYHKDKFIDWISFGNFVRSNVPLVDQQNVTNKGFVSPYDFISQLSKELKEDDVIIPCSSGGAFTVTMQALENKLGQTIISNKGLASMGYGLAGAIGASIATNRRTILIEGDGGFIQNLQELGTLNQLGANLIIFLFSNQGYASIRMTQRNYFGGAYIGCDNKTGLGLPDWESICDGYQVRYFKLDDSNLCPAFLQSILQMEGPVLVEVGIDPEQTYWPKIESRMLPDGSMASNPLHMMTPLLDSAEVEKFLPYLLTD